MKKILKRTLAALLAAALMLSGAVLAAQEETGLLCHDLVLSFEEGSSFGAVRADAELKNNSDEEREAFLWIASYEKSGKLSEVSYKSLTLSAGAKAEDFVTVLIDKDTKSIRSGVWDKENLRPLAKAKEYPRSFIFGTPGNITNVYYNGKAVSSVYGVPSVGIKPLDIYGDPSLGDVNTIEGRDKRIAAVKALAGTKYDTNAYTMFSTNAMKGKWDTPINSSNEIYGYPSNNIIAGDEANGKSILYGEKVTRLWKVSNEESYTKEQAKSLYEFDIDKGATVYITLSINKWNNAEGEVRSEYIESLSDGWIYDHDTEKYCLKMWDATELEGSGGEKANVPNGKTRNSIATAGSVYYKHFNAGERVIIPAYTDEFTDDYNLGKRMGIFVVWDDISSEYGLYGASFKGADGSFVPVEGFDTNVQEYNIELQRGTVNVPDVSLTATRPTLEEALWDIPSGFEDSKAVVSVTAKLKDESERKYTFNFFAAPEADKDARLQSVSFDGEPFSEFNTYVYEYEKELPYGVPYPILSAEACEAGADVSIVQPKDAGGIGKITVTAKDGVTKKEYIFTFTNLSYIPAEAQIMEIKDGKDAIVTIVHDDGDFVTMGFLNDEFEKNDLKGTVGLIANKIYNPETKEYIEPNLSRWQEYYKTGRFSFSSHSMTHTWMGSTDEGETVYFGGEPVTYPPGHMSEEIKLSQEVIRGAFEGEGVNTFIFPGTTPPDGMVNTTDAAREMVKENYIAGRVTRNQFNSVPPQDWYNVTSFMVENVINYDDPKQEYDANTDAPLTTAASYWIDLSDEAIEDGKWLIYLFHSIPKGESNSSIYVLQSRASMLFDKLGDDVLSGRVWNAFYEEAVLYLKEAESASAEAKGYGTGDGRYTLITVSDGLDNEIYNYPLTVKTEVPEDWDIVLMTQGERAEIVKAFEEGGKRYVYANVVPDIGAARIEQAPESEYVSVIKVGGKELEGFDPAKFSYEIELEYGEVAPIVEAEGANVTQAQDFGTFKKAVVTKETGGVPVVYEIRFKNKPAPGPAVLLKLDGLESGEKSLSAFSNVVEFLDSKGVNANIGVTGSALIGADANYLETVKGFVRNHELFVNGYTYSEDEFVGKSAAEQKEIIERTDSLFREKLEVVPSAFGAPYNIMDSATCEALGSLEGSYIKNIYFAPKDIPGKVNLSESIAFEQQGEFSGEREAWLVYNKFTKEYEDGGKDKEYLVLECHPKEWALDTESVQFKTFEDQINYLIANGAVFETAAFYSE